MCFYDGDTFPVKRSHGGGGRAADFNDQSHDDVVAAAHKNVSLGCRNISVETYRRGNAGGILDSRAGHAQRSYLPSADTFVPLSFSLVEKHETDRPPNNRSAKKNRSTKHALLPIIVLIISVTQSTPVSRRVLASRFPSRFSLVSVCCLPKQRPSSALPCRRLPYNHPSLSFFVPSALNVRVASSSLLSSLFLAARRLLLSISESNCGILDDRLSKFNN